MFHWINLLRQVWLQYDDYNGKKVLSRPRILFVRHFIRILLFCAAVRHFVAAIVYRSGKEKYAFYLSNFTYGQGYSFSFGHMLIISIFQVWCFLAEFNWHAMSRNRKNFWLRFLPAAKIEINEDPHRFEKLFNLGESKYHKLMTYYFSVSKFLYTSVILNGILVATFCSLHYYLGFRNIETEPWRFWLIFIFNAIFIHIDAPTCFIITVANPFFFIFLGQMFRLKLINLRRKMEQLNSLKLYHKLPDLMHQLRIIENELRHINSFWKAELGVNYTFSIVSISLTSMLVYISESVGIQITFTCLIIFLQVFCLMLPLWMAGQVNLQARSTKN